MQPFNGALDNITSSFTTNRNGLSTEQAYHILEKEQGRIEWSPRYDGVSELLYTILSQHTSDLNSLKAFQSLRDKFWPWERITQAKTEDIAKAIWMGGLSKVKAPRIKRVLQDIQDKCGVLDLSFLKRMPMDKAKEWLQELPGVGPKTAAVVLCFAMGMPAMPVDTHIYRVTKRLGFISPKDTPEQAHSRLEASIRPEHVFAFHMYLITHGRQVCKARRPLCQQCVLSVGCPSGFQI